MAFTKQLNPRGCWIFLYLNDSVTEEEVAQCFRTAGLTTDVSDVSIGDQLTGSGDQACLLHVSEQDVCDLVAWQLAGAKLHGREVKPLVRRRASDTIAAMNEQPKVHHRKHALQEK